MRKTIATMAFVAIAIPSVAAFAAEPQGLERIEHVIVLYLENRSFDNMFALFPGANGLDNALRAPPQVDLDGTVYHTLPPVMDTSVRPPVPDPRFPADLPNRPWLIDAYIPHTARMSDLTHLFYQNQQQIDGGRNDLFAAVSNAGGLTMGYHDNTGTTLWKLAQDYTLADNFFQGAFGGSFLNHQWLACACAPVYADAPDSLRIKLDAKGRVIKDGNVTLDGYAVNTIHPRLGPYGAKASDPTQRLPPQTAPTLGDRLSDKGVSWAWYSGGWRDAEAGKAGPEFQFHHQPYAFFARYVPGTPDRAQHLKDDTQLASDIAKGTLPQVVFVKPYGLENQHPGYANLADADRYTDTLVKRLQASPYWPTTAIIITYDEFGGLWDHVSPPKGDRWGPGTRIPAIVVSPFAKKGFIDHTQYDTTSVLKTIETRFGLAPLGPRDEAVAPMLNAFDFDGGGK
jgi:phospholipase C